VCSDFWDFKFASWNGSQVCSQIGYYELYDCIGSGCPNLGSRRSFRLFNDGLHYLQIGVNPSWGKVFMFFFFNLIFWVCLDISGLEVTGTLTITRLNDALPSHDAIYLGEVSSVDVSGNGEKIVVVYNILSGLDFLLTFVYFPSSISHAFSILVQIKQSPILSCICIMKIP